MGKKENIKVDGCKGKGPLVASGEAAGVYVGTGQSNGGDQSLVTCETVVSDDNP